MTLRTTLLVAATAADSIQLDRRDVLRPLKIQDGALCCSRGQDDWWVIVDQEIDVDEFGTALVQVREEGAVTTEMLTIRFTKSRPLTEADLAAVRADLDLLSVSGLS